MKDNGLSKKNNKPLIKPTGSICNTFTSSTLKGAHKFTDE